MDNENYLMPKSMNGSINSPLIKQSIDEENEPIIDMGCLNNKRLTLNNGVYIPVISEEEDGQNESKLFFI